MKQEKMGEKYRLKPTRQDLSLGKVVRYKIISIFYLEYTTSATSKPLPSQVIGVTDYFFLSNMEH